MEEVFAPLIAASMSIGLDVPLSLVQQPPEASDPLYVLVGELASRAVAEENAASERDARSAGEPVADAYRYRADQIEIHRGDFDTDNDVDALVVIYTCEETNCHTTTRSTTVAHLAADRTDYQLGHHRRYNLRAEITNLWAMDGIELKLTEYGPDDPTCCPTRESTITIPVRRRQRY